MTQHLFQRLAVLLKNAERKKGQHQNDHQHCRRLVSDTAPCENISRDSHQTACAETQELAFCQIKRELAFYPRQVLGNRDIGHFIAPPDLLIL